MLQGYEGFLNSVEGIIGKRKAGWRVRNLYFSDIETDDALIERLGKVEEHSTDTKAEEA